MVVLTRRLSCCICYQEHQRPKKLATGKNFGAAHVVEQLHRPANIHHTFVWQQLAVSSTDGCQKQATAASTRAGTKEYGPRGKPAALTAHTSRAC